MAKMFYTAKEAAEQLSTTEQGLKDLVREGKIREFRDAGTFNYKVEDVEALAASLAPQAASAEPKEEVAAGGDEIILEPADDSSIELAAAGSDVLDLEDADTEDSALGTGTAAVKAKEDTVVPSVGVNVFDDDDLDEHVDPLAQTAVTDVAGLGVEGTGSGSGILDLTRESDDTSLGAELLEEIYSGEGEEEAAVEVGEKTRAGLDEAIPEEAAEPEAALGSEPRVKEAEEVAVAEAMATASTGAVVREVVEYAPDPLSKSLTALLVVAVVVMLFAGLGGAALVGGITPALLGSVYAKLWLYAVGALGAAVVAAGITYFMAKRSS